MSEPGRAQFTRDGAVFEVSIVRRIRVRVFEGCFGRYALPADFEFGLTDDGYCFVRQYHDENARVRDPLWRIVDGAGPVTVSIVKQGKEI